jgi:hypothetical protein
LFCVLNIPSSITAFDVGSAMGMLWIVAGKSLFITTINGHPLLDMFCSIAITSVAVGPAPEWHDNNCFVTGHEDGSLRFWKLRHEQSFNKPEAPSDSGTVVFQRGRCLSHFDSMLQALHYKPFCRYKAHLIALYNRETPNFTGEIHGSSVCHIKFISDIVLVTGSSDGAVFQVLCFRTHFGDCLTDMAAVAQWVLVGTGQTTHWMHDSAVSECATIICSRSITSHCPLASRCNDCRVKFNLVERKHHCRNCGNVFCASVIALSLLVALCF